MKIIDLKTYIWDSKCYSILLLAWPEENQEMRNAPKGLLKIWFLDKTTQQTASNEEEDHLRL